MIVLYVLCLIVVILILQTTLAEFVVELAGAKPDLILLVVLSLGLSRGKRAGIGYGWLLGLIQDILSGSLLGQNVLSKGIIGYLTGILHRNLGDLTMISHLVIVPLATLFDAAISFGYSVSPVRRTHRETGPYHGRDHYAPEYDRQPPGELVGQNIRPQNLGSAGRGLLWKAQMNFRKIRRSSSQIEAGSINRRLIVIGSVFLFLIGILALRLWILQVIQGEVLRRRSENNRIETKPVPGIRGKILDRNGLLLARNRAAFHLALIPRSIPDLENSLSRLKEQTGLDPVRAMAEIRRGNPFKPIIVQRNLSREAVAQVMEHRWELPGVLIQINPQREYPYNAIAAQMMGYLGKISKSQLKKEKDYRHGDMIGKQGIERDFEETLRGIERQTVGRGGRIRTGNQAVGGKAGQTRQELGPDAGLGITANSRILDGRPTGSADCDRSPKRGNPRTRE